MGTVYGLSSLIGYFLVLLIFLVLAVIFAKTKFGWILYCIGAVLQLVSLIGRQKSLSMFGFGSAMSTYWIVYVVLLVIAAIIVGSRHSN